MLQVGQSLPQLQLVLWVLWLLGFPLVLLVLCYLPLQLVLGLLADHLHLFRRYFPWVLGSQILQGDLRVLLLPADQFHL